MTCRNDFFYYYYFDNLVTAFFEKRGGVINFLPLKRGALNREFTVFYIPGGGYSREFWIGLCREG